MKDIESLPTFSIRGSIAPKNSFLQDMGQIVSASDVADFIKANKDAPELVFEISSDGGYRGEGVEIYNLMKTSGKKITTITYKANSIATVIMLGGSTRLIVEHANCIVHFARIDPINLGMEALTAEDFSKLADEVERADRQIVDIYCTELGEEKRMELVAAMADERDLGAKGAIKLGFATGYYKKAKKEKPSVEDFKGALITDHLALLIENNMSKEAENKFEKLIQNFSKFMAKAVGKIKNEVTLTLGDGKQIYVVPADVNTPDELMGGKVYEIDEAGLPTETPVADGEYVLDDGRTLIVGGGVVTEIKDSEAKTEEVNKILVEENKKLAEKVAALEKEKGDSIKALEDVKTEMKKEVDSIKMAWSEFKKEVPGDKGDKKEDVQLPKDFSKMSTAQKVRALSKERALVDQEMKSKLN